MTLTTFTSPWMTRAEAADYLRMSAKTLANLASLGEGPKFQKRSGTLRYHRDVLDGWLNGDHVPVQARATRGRPVGTPLAA